MNEQPRFRRLASTGAMVLWRVCAVCGAPWAGWGYGVIPPSLGTWYCYPHRPDAERAP